MDAQVKKEILPKRDLLLILILLFCSTLVFLGFLLFRKPGERVEVTVDGVLVGTYSLTENSAYSLNGGTNLLVIENGEAYIKEADCPDETCVRTGKIHHTGERIVCLPNRIVITVKGTSDTDLTV